MRYQAALDEYGYIQRRTAGYHEEFLKNNFLLECTAKYMTFLYQVLEGPYDDAGARQNFGLLLETIEHLPFAIRTAASRYGDGTYGVKCAYTWKIGLFWSRVG